MRIRYTTFLAPLALFLLTACEEVEQVVDHYRDLTPREAYVESLRQAELAEAALGREWIDAGRSALEEPAQVDLPYREEGWLPPEAPTAVGYRMSLVRGQVVTVDVSLQEADGADSVRLFLDLLRVPEDSADPFRPVQRLDTLETGRYAYEPYRDGEYVLRVQPELLRGGRYRISLSLDPALAFPVEGRDTRAIQSFFGAPRDAGRRSHHGVDIFAPRGTPVLAAADGRVRRANETPIGGRVVWLSDSERDMSLYYAHLDSQVVRRGQRVRRGDTIGFVGNTGNARTTPPHLHFGIYRRGPRDPIDYVREIRRPMPGWPGDPARIGEWVRTLRDGARLRAGPVDGQIVAELEPDTPLRVVGGNEGWWRVRLPDGRSGYIASRITEPVEAEPVAERVATAGEAVRVAPGGDAPVLAALQDGARVTVLGRFRGFELVEARTTTNAPARRGWMPVLRRGDG